MPWLALADSGWLWLAMASSAGPGWLLHCFALVGYGCFGLLLLARAGSGWLWRALAGAGWIWLGWLWPALAGSGWLRQVGLASCIRLIDVPSTYLAPPGLHRFSRICVWNYVSFRKQTAIFNYVSFRNMPDLQGFCLFSKKMMILGRPANVLL